MIANSHPNHQPTLLLIEDDELVRDATTRLFVREGYLVLTAATGHAAIGVLRTPSSSVDVVLLDVGLPDVSGADLCARIRQFFPNLPVVVCTGEASQEEVDELHRQGITCLLSKPTAVPDLVAAVNSAYKEKSEPRL